MKEKIEKKIKELEELYDWNLQKSEDMHYINTWSILEQRIHDLRIEIYTYKKVLEMLENKEIERLNNIINEFNSSYYKIIKECEEMINDRYYMNENAIKYHANRIRDIAKYYVEEPKWQELKGDDK